MSIEAEIEAAVSAFVAELRDLVRMAALESVRDALGSPEGPPPPRRKASPPRPPRKVGDIRGSGREGGRTPPPASLRPRGSGPPTVRSFQVEPGGLLPARGPIAFGKAKPEAPPPVTFAPGVVVRHIPPKRRRDGRSASPPPPPPPPVLAETGPAEPAKKWVVVRRPARAPSEPPVQAAPAAPSPEPTRPTSAPARPETSRAATPVTLAPQPLAGSPVGGDLQPPAQPVLMAEPSGQAGPRVKLGPASVDVEAPTSKPPASKSAKAPPSRAPVSSKAPTSKAKGPASKRAGHDGGP